MRHLFDDLTNEPVRRMDPSVVGERARLSLITSLPTPSTYYNKIGKIVHLVRYERVNGWCSPFEAKHTFMGKVNRLHAHRTVGSACEWMGSTRAMMGFTSLASAQYIGECYYIIVNSIIRETGGKKHFDQTLFGVTNRPCLNKVWSKCFSLPVSRIMEFTIISCGAKSFP